MKCILDAAMVYNKTVQDYINKYVNKITTFLIHSFHTKNITNQGN